MNSKSNSNSKPKSRAKAKSRAVYVLVYEDGEMVFQSAPDADPDREVIGGPWKIPAVGADFGVRPPWHDLLPEITCVYFDTHIYPASTAFWFSGAEELLEIANLSRLHTGNVRDMAGMFKLCRSLTALDVSGFDTSKAVWMQLMFAGCESLEKLDVSGFDTSNAAYMYHMFADCESLAELDVSGFDVSNGKDISEMFMNCSALEDLDTDRIFQTLKPGTQYSCLLRGCDKIEALFKEFVGILDSDPLHDSLYESLFKKPLFG